MKGRVWLTPAFRLKPMAKVLVDFDPVVQTVDKGHALLLSKEGQYCLLDADLNRVKDGLFPFSFHEPAKCCFLVDKMLFVFGNKKQVVVLDLVKDEILLDIHVKGNAWKESWMSPGSCLSPDGLFLYITTAHDEKHINLDCWKIAERKMVGSVELNCELQGHWYVETRTKSTQKDKLLLCVNTYAGQDGAEYQSVVHDSKENRLTLLENNSELNNVTDVIYSALDGSSFEMGNRDNEYGEEEIEPEDDEINFGGQVVPCNWKLDHALVLTDAGRLFTISLADPTVLADYVVLKGHVTSHSTRLWRGLQTRLITCDGSNVMLWDANELFRTYFEWIDWAPATHRLFPASFREGVKTLLLCLLQLDSRVPKDIRKILVVWAARAWLHNGHQNMFTMKKQKS